MSTPTSPEPPTRTELLRAMLSDREKLRAAVAERDALRAAIQAAEELVETYGEQAMARGSWSTSLPPFLNDLRAALAAAGVDREDAEQPQQCNAESGYLGYRCDLPAGHDGRHRTHTETWWGDSDAHLVVELGQRIANDDGRRFSLADVAAEFGVDTGQADEPQRRRGIPDAMDGPFDPPAGQVVPQQPTCEHGETEAHDYRIYTFGGRPYEALCPGPVGQDTTGEQQQ